MTWLRVFSATAFTVCLVTIASVVWFSSSHGSRALSSLQGTCDATIVIRLKDDDPVVFRPVDGSLRCGGPDRQTYVVMLRSNRLSDRTIASFSRDEFGRIFGTSFLQTGLTPFTGVQIEASQDDRQLIAIRSSHPDPAAARLVVERLYSELIKLHRDIHVNANEDAMRFLYEKRTELVDRTQKAEARLEEARQLQDTNSIREAENAARISRQLQHNIEDRIAATAASGKNVPPFPFGVVEARLVTGPFWNRTETDFTSEVAQLERR